MHFENYPFPEEELEDDKFEFGNKLNPTDLKESYKRKPKISYDYIDLDKTDYHFAQECFDYIDAFHYFSTLKTFCSYSINELTDVLDKDFHFHIDPVASPRIQKILNRLIDIKDLTPEQIPPIGQFALYTDENGASRETQIKSPRIYFMVGPKGILYILFYDPYHEIKKMPTL